MNATGNTQPPPPRAHVFQHVPFEGPGALAPWLRRAGYDLTTTRFYETAEMPDPAAVDFLIVMGGPMSVHDESRFPWLVDEKRYLQRYLATGKPLLGVCLGAQLLAGVLGARVHAQPVMEIGWFPVFGIPHPGPAAFRFPAAADVFHWHGETFDLPPGAVHLAHSAACENQAFQMGAAIGLQFHLETTLATARALVEHTRHEQAAGPGIQSAAEILAAPPGRYDALHRLLDGVLSHLLPAAALRLS
jgi:GMP synthase-like glutamine amidotransferase